MIVKRHTRKKILKKLWDKLNAGKPLFCASCSIGLTAKLLEIAGVDLINTFGGSRLRRRYRKTSCNIRQE